LDIQDAYSQWSATYDLDRNLTRDLDQRVTREVLADLRYHTLLEIGCGTGKNTTFFASISEHVHAFDFSAGMLKQAKEKVSSDHVAFVTANLKRNWPCKAQSIEFIACNLVLEHIQDLSVIFSEAFRVLTAGGLFFISELHPFRQYRGTQANYQRGQTSIEIQAFIHHLSDFTEAARQNGLSLNDLKEWWHVEDQGKPPRLVSFLFEKRA
jgi:malonyl-CoA O-methyltransferase